MRTRISIVLAALLCLVASPSLLAQYKAAEAVLASNGLTKVGLTYLLDGDLKLRDSLRAMRKARSEMDAGVAKRSQLEKKIKLAEDALQNGEAQDEALGNQLSKAKGNVDRYNQIVGQLRALEGQMRDAARFGQECQKELSKFPDPRDNYITAVLDISDSMEATEAQYERLAADPAVQKALAGINAEARAKMKLGPSAEFAHELPFVRHERSSINSSAIKFNNETGTPQLNVTLNGTVTVPMILDSGASVVSISWDVAQKLGMTPGPNDPKVKFNIADGRQVEATIMTLKTVRLGPFTAENVVCSVAPESEKNTPNLLGGTFLEHFVYKMDLGAGVVHMSQLTGKSSASDASTAVSASPGSASPGSGTASAGSSAPAVPKPGGANPSGDSNAAPDPSLLVEKGWTILFRSSDPADWNTQLRDASSYAVPLEKAPTNMAFLRMRNSLGEYVIISLTAAELRQNVMHGKAGWEGRDYKASSARHLGVIVTSMPTTESGSIDVTQAPPIGGLTGYGFGNRVGKDDQQGYVWAGKPIDASMLEIAVKAGELTAAEKQRLISD
jgi:clan AA aspartic protease (TIGR02281 family)